MVDTIEDGEIGIYADFDNRYLRRDGRFGVERAALTRLPIIDFAPILNGGSRADRQRVAAELRAACVDIGFFYLVNHGIPAAELNEVVTWGHRFFELPLDEKMKVLRAPGTEGYLRVGGMNPEANPDKAPDLKERFSANRETLPGEPDLGGLAASRNRWPDEHVLPGFERFLRAHIAKRLALTQRLAGAFALSLDLPDAFFDRYFRYPTSNLIINYYPPLDPTMVETTRWSFSPHTDYGIFTLLSQDGLGGLQVRNAAGEWIDVPPVDGSFVVNIGDLFATWTNDLFTSNLHRAVNASRVARISVPFFVSPQGDLEIACLPSCQSRDNPPRYPPVVVEPYLRSLVAQSYRTGRVGITKQTAERFQKR